jgi:hypothetical protein
MKRARAGSLELFLTPEELMKKLATLVPPPRAHGVRYHGVPPYSKARRRVVPAQPEPVHAPVAEPLKARRTHRIPCQLVPEIGQEPGYEAALRAVHG